MIPVHNPYTHREGYHCFGCCPTNPIGLQMRFFMDGEDLVSFWSPTPDYQGWNNLLHGGIQATLVDEIGSWFAILRAQTSGVTGTLSMRYRKPVPTDKGDIKLIAHLHEVRKNVLSVDVLLYDPDGNLCSEGKASYFMFPKERAREQFAYPGPEAFFPEGENV